MNLFPTTPQFIFQWSHVTMKVHDFFATWSTENYDKNHHRP